MQGRTLKTLADSVNGQATSMTLNAKDAVNSEVRLSGIHPLHLWPDPSSLVDPLKVDPFLKGMRSNLTSNIGYANPNDIGGDFMLTHLSSSVDNVRDSSALIRHHVSG